MRPEVSSIGTAFCSSATASSYLPWLLRLKAWAWRRLPSAGLPPVLAVGVLLGVVCVCVCDEAAGAACVDDLVGDFFFFFAAGCFLVGGVTAAVPLSGPPSESAAIAPAATCRTATIAATGIQRG